MNIKPENETATPTLSLIQKLLSWVDKPWKVLGLIMIVVVVVGTYIVWESREKFVDAIIEVIKN
jgi:hypothetical protein